MFVFIYEFLQLQLTLNIQFLYINVIDFCNFFFKQIKIVIKNQSINNYEI